MPDPEPYPTPQQQRILWSALTALAVIALTGVGALVFLGFIAFLSWAYPILLPIGLAIIVALFLEPLVDWIQKRGMNRARATLTVCILSVIAFALFWSYLLPPIYKQSYAFFQDLPKNLNKAVVKLQLAPSDFSGSTNAAAGKAPATNTSTTNAIPEITPLSPAVTNSTPLTSISHLTLTTPHSAPGDWLPNTPHLNVSASPPSGASAASAAFHAWLTGNLPAIQESIQRNIASLLVSALGPVGQAFGFILGFGFVPIYVFYFLADQEDISRHWHEYVPLRRSRLRDEVVSVLSEINQSLVSYFRGQIIVAACNGVLTFIGLWIIDVPYSLVLGMITGALSIVPFLGIIASILPALLLGYLSANGDPTWQWLSPLLVLVVFTLVQMSESMFITPRVQSHSTGLHPLAIILGILFWSLLLPGLLGPIVAVPLTCAIVVLLRRYVWVQTKPAASEAKPQPETPAAS